MLKGFNQWFGPGLPENIKSFQKHRPVARYVKHPAAHPSDTAILDAKPMLQEVQLQSEFTARRDGNYITEVSKSMPFVKTTIGDFR